MIKLSKSVGEFLRRELTSPKISEYFILINRLSIDFLCVSGSGKVNLLFSSQSDKPITIEKFFSELSQESAYFGQPVKIILNNEHCYTYFKRLGTISPAQLLEKLTMIRGNQWDSMQSIIKYKDISIFAYQALYKEYLQQIYNSVSKYNIRVTEIIPLPTLLLINDSITSKNRELIKIYELPSGTSLFSIFNRDSILFSHLDNYFQENKANNINSSFEQIEQIFCPGNKSTIREVFPYSATKSLPGIIRKNLGELFLSRTSRINTINSLSYKLPNSRRALILRVTLNSSKLCATILLSIAFLTMLTSLLISAWSSTLSEPLGVYQQKYSQKLTVSHKLDSLNHAVNHLRLKNGEPEQNAAIISSFCQKKYKNIYLTEISIRNDVQNNSPHVEIKGNALSEKTIFSYHKYLSTLLMPHRLTVNSVKPNQRVQRKGLDSLLLFKMSLELRGDLDKK